MDNEKITIELTQEEAAHLYRMLINIEGRGQIKKSIHSIFNKFYRKVDNRLALETVNPWVQTPRVIEE